MLSRKETKLKLNNTEVVYDLYTITGGSCNKNTPNHIKMDTLSYLLNRNKWHFMGFLNFGSKIRLKPKFHNVRDSRGRFVSMKKNTNKKNTVNAN